MHERTTIELHAAAALLGVEKDTLLFLLDEAALPLREGNGVALDDLVSLRRHPDLAHGLDPHGLAEREFQQHARERAHLLGRIRELERRIDTQRSEIEALRRAVLAGHAERAELRRQADARQAS